MRRAADLAKWLRRKQIASILLVFLGALATQGGRFLPPDPQWDIRWLPLWVFLIAAVLAFIVLEKLAPRRVSVRLGAPLVLRPDQDSSTEARAGLVALISKYKLFGKPLPPPEVIQTALKNCDYEPLDLERSNLAPIIQAVTTHRAHLRHCWLIGSEGTKSQDPIRQGETLGSVDFIPLLVKYLREKEGIQCTFWYGKRYAVPLDDDSLVYRKTHDLVHRVFRESEGLNVAPSEMAVDFTGGVRGMSAGALLACLDGERDVEFLGTHYDDNDEPIFESSFLVIVPFEADVPRG